jgi:hypothetical protein
LWDVAGHKMKAPELHARLDLLKQHGLVTSHSEPAQGNGHKPAERWRPATMATGNGGRWN